MIDPVIFEFNILGLPIILRWYGVLVMAGAVFGALIAEYEIKRRGENGESIWDAMVWVLPAGIVGARLWYVVNNILGGSDFYTSDPSRIIRVWEGGLHFFGGLLFGGIALYIYLKQQGMDIWLFLDAIAPAALIGQALARPANFINQELYGQPTNLPWGIPIDEFHRLSQYADLSLYPVETTRFHPTFAYEMILNILLGLLLLWIAHRYAESIKPGTIFAGWLVAAGAARVVIEFFRPDQPRIGDSFMSYSMLVSILMAVFGAVMLLVRSGKIQLAFAQNWEEDYFIKGARPEVKKPQPRPQKPVVVRKEPAVEVKPEIQALPAVIEEKVVTHSQEMTQPEVIQEEKVMAVEAAPIVVAEESTEPVAIPAEVKPDSKKAPAKKKPAAKKTTTAAGKKPAGKSPAKKPAAKKSPAKKPIAKKAPVKKPAAAKKPAAPKKKPSTGSTD